MAQGGRFKVLVVDDDQMLRDLAASVLCDLYVVETAFDGQDGLEKALAWTPDLVITDIMMPRMHGFELCQRLKSEKSLPGLKVMVASSKAFPADIAQAKNAGADDYILKPYDLDKLLAKTAALLEGASSAAPAAPAAAPAAAAGQAPEEADASCFVRFWGTRGSIPVSSQAAMRHGGNTACVELRAGGQIFIFDCGTGMRDLGLSLAKEFKGRPLRAHIFVGHTHWDHIQGFPFFVPLYNPANSFSVYSVHGAHGSLDQVFRGTMSEDYFPVPLSGLAAGLRFVELSGEAALGGARVTFRHLNHPGVCIGFRVEAAGRTVTYVSDHESFRKLGGDNELSRRQDAEIADFCRGSDLLIREAQYTEEEYPPRRGWGHSTFDDVVSESAAAGVKRLALTHHDPDHGDDFLDAQAARCAGLAGGGFEVFTAKDGMKVDL